MVIPVLLLSQFTDEGGNARTRLCDSPPVSVSRPSGDTCPWSPGGRVPSSLALLLQAEGW